MSGVRCTPVLAWIISVIRSRVHCTPDIVHYKNLKVFQTEKSRLGGTFTAVLIATEFIITECLNLQQEYLKFGLLAHKAVSLILQLYDHHK
jgi:hypothetical protein